MSNIKNLSKEELENAKSLFCYIPKSESEHKENLDVIKDGNNHCKVNVVMEPKPIIQHEAEMWDKLKDFESGAWSNKSDGLKTGFKTIDEAFDGGIVPAFYLIASDSNLGKTAIISQIAYNTARINDNVYVMDFSLDDPFQDKVSRVIGCDAKITMNSVKNPKRYAVHEEVMNRRKYALMKLYNNSNKYKIYDATFTTDIEKIEEEVIKVKLENDAIGVNKKIVVCIDNFHDLTSSLHPSYQDKQKYDYLAQACADLAIKHNLALICTAELKKQNGVFRPSIDAVRELTK